MYNTLKSLTIDVSDILETLQKLVKKSPLTLFQDSHFLKLSRGMMADFLRDDDLAVGNNKFNIFLTNCR
jgi:hypothetical protein